MSATTEGMEQLALPDMERRLSNAMRMGTVAEVDYAKARVKVKSGNITTAWLPWAAGSANSAKRRWDPPQVGEQVAVLSPGGDLAQGLVMPGIYQQAAGAPSDSGDKDTTVYSDGTVIEYDRAAHALVADLQGTKVFADRNKIELTIGSTKLTMTAAGSVFEGPVTVNGLLTYTEGLTGSGGSGAAIDGPLAVTGGTVKHDGKNIGSSHTHTGVSPGGGTTGAPT